MKSSDLLRAGMLLSAFCLASMCLENGQSRGDEPQEKASSPAAHPLLASTGGALSEVDRANEIELRDQLKLPTEVDLVDMPLKDLIDYLKDRHSIQIFADQKALEEAGVSLDAPITLNAEEISLAAVLDLVVEPLGLTWAVRNGLLWITTEEREAEMLETRIYPVADLLRRDAEGTSSLRNLTNLLTSTVRPVTWSEAGGSGEISYYAGVLSIYASPRVHDELTRFLNALREGEAIVAREIDAHPAPPAQASAPQRRIYRLGQIDSLQMMEVITALVEPDSWQAPGVKMMPLSGDENALVVQQSGAVHEQITQLLESIRSSVHAKPHQGGMGGMGGGMGGGQF